MIAASVLVLVVSFPVGLLLAEIVLRTLAGARVRERVGEIGAILRAFHQVDRDEARQALLVRSGIRTLQFSCGALLVLMALAAIACLPPWILDCNEAQQIVYFVALSFSSTWWWMRRRS